MKRFVQLRQGWVRFSYVLALFVLLFGSAYALLNQITPQRALAAPACNSNSAFPLKPSPLNTNTCLGQVDNDTYSFEVIFCARGTLTITISGKSLEPAPSGSYKMAGVNNCGDTGGVSYATTSAGNDQYGDPIALLVKANAACTDTITFSGTNQDTQQKGSAVGNPCDMINQFKSQGTVSFPLVYQTQAQDTHNCTASQQFPLTQSPYSDACIGIVNDSQQSFQFVVDASLVADPISVTLTDPGAVLSPGQYGFSDPHTYIPGLVSGSYISGVSGHVGTTPVGIMVKNPACHNGNLTLTVADANGPDSKILVNTCDLINAAAACHSWIFVFQAHNHETVDFNFATYNCGQPVLGGNCGHETHTKFDPYIPSHYNSNVCVGRLSDQNTTAHGLISADIIVTVENTTSNDPVVVGVTGDNIGARNIPQLNQPPCQDGQTSGCSNLTPDQAAQLQNPFDRIDDKRYHSGPASSVSFLALYSGNCSILNSAACSQTPDGKLYPAFSGTGILANDPCDPNATIIVTAKEPKTGYSGQTSVKICDIIANHYAINVTVRLAAPSTVCTTGTGFAGAVAWVLCPIVVLAVGAIDFIEQNLIIPYLTVSPLSTDSGNAVYRLWEVMRNVGNVLFILAFFFIIFSQATSIGLSNYGIKRMLPKLVWVAIVANVSYYLVAFAIDLFNILGAGVGGLVMGIVTTGGGGSGAATADWKQFFAIGGVALTASIVTAGAALGWLGFLLIVVFLIVLVAVIVLVIRQMLLVLLAILLPIIFVGRLFPNMEKRSDRALQLLFKLLVMYPMIVLLFAAGKIVGGLLTSGDIQFASGQAGSDQVSQSIKVILAAFAQAFPLLLLPVILLASDEILAGVARVLQEQAATWTERGRNRYKNSNFGKYRAGLRAERERQVHSGNYSGWRLEARLRARLNQRLNTNPAYNFITQGYGGHITLEDRKKRDVNRIEAIKYFNNDYGLAEAWLKSGGNKQATYAYTVAPGGETIRGVSYAAGTVISRNAYEELETPAQKLVFDQMVANRLDKKAESFTAAIQMVAENGRGTASMLADAERQVRRLNPGSQQMDLNALRNNIEFIWRDRGRGDLANVNIGSGAVTPEWSSMDMSHLSRHIFDTRLLGNAADPAAPGKAWKTRSFIDPRDPAKKLIRKNISTAEASLRSYLYDPADPSRSKLNIRQLVEALPRMEKRARGDAEIMIFDILRGKIRADFGFDKKAFPLESPFYASGPGDIGKLLDQLRSDLKLQETRI